MTCICKLSEMREQESVSIRSCTVRRCHVCVLSEVELIKTEMSSTFNIIVRESNPRPAFSRGVTQCVEHQNRSRYKAKPSKPCVLQAGSNACISRLLTVMIVIFSSLENLGDVRMSSTLSHASGSDENPLAEKDTKHISVEGIWRNFSHRNMGETPETDWTRRLSERR